MPAQQTFKNHAKFVPAFHFFVVPVLIANVIISIIRFVHQVNFERGFGILVAFALLVTAFLARIFALTVQDRVIRLEMRLRLRELLPADLQPRVSEFKVGQLVALRFASDAELPTLARKVLDDGTTDKKSIKQMIQVWQPDNLRV